MAQETTGSGISNAEDISIFEPSVGINLCANADVGRIIIQYNKKVIKIRRFIMKYYLLKI